MIRNKLIFTIAAVVLLMTSCSTPNYPSLDDLRKVDKSDFYKISLSDIKPKEINLDLLGIYGIRYFDSLLVVSVSGPEPLVQIYDRYSLDSLGGFFNKGRGPMELLYPLSDIYMSLSKESGVYMMRFVDNYSSRFVEVNLSESIKNGELVLNEWNLKNKKGLFTALPLDGSRYFMKRLTKNGTYLERSICDAEGKDSTSSAMLKLSSYHINKNDGYNINLLSGIVGYNRSKGLFIEAMTLLNSVHVYPEEGDGGFTLCYGKDSPDIQMLEKQSPNLRTYHAGISINDNYFSVMYTDESLVSTKKEIQGYSWDGKPLFRIPLSSDISDYDIDGESGTLLTVDDRDNIKEYNIEYLRTLGTECVR